MTGDTPNKNLERIWTALSSILAQVPWLTTVTGTYPVSLYQPSIYHGKELFLLAPLMVSVVATWAVIQWRAAMWGIVVLFTVLVPRFLRR
jgi:hypothetical protein